MMPVFEVIKPGILSTIQDCGLTGYRAFGVPVGGAVDKFSLRVANLLVGNEEFAAALEVTVSGPVLRVFREAAIAVTGGDLSPLVNDEPLPMWETAYVQKGDIISFGERRNGCRSYLTVSGGFDIPAILGAKTTNTRVGMGGLDGRSLRKGDILKKHLSNMQNKIDLELPMEYRPVYKSNTTLRMIAGPHYKLFAKTAINDFINTTFVVGKKLDRMGIFLTGNPITAPKGERISQPVTPGTVQIPPAGEPIILLAECQTTGGYPHIATLITADLGLAGQLFTNDSVDFKLISMNQAKTEMLQQENTIAAVRQKKIIKRIYRTDKNSYEIVLENMNCLDTGEEL